MAGRLINAAGSAGEGRRREGHGASRRSPVVTPGGAGPAASLTGMGPGEFRSPESRAMTALGISIIPYADSLDRNRGLMRLCREFCDPGNAGCKMTRLRSRPKPARPYIWRLIILILFTMPSTLPEL